MREAFASLAILLAASAAHADIARGSGSRAALQGRTPAVETASLAAGGGILVSWQVPTVHSPASACRAGGAFTAVRHQPAGTGGESSVGRITALPPAPGCDALCLSGLLSIGALQALRRARHLHLHLPEWYHADALGLQIGHSIPFEFQPTLVPLPVLHGAILVADVPHAPTPMARWRFDNLSPASAGQSSRLPSAPRGPPASSF